MLLLLGATGSRSSTASIGGLSCSGFHFSGDAGINLGNLTVLLQLVALHRVPRRVLLVSRWRVEKQVRGAVFLLGVFPLFIICVAPIITSSPLICAISLREFFCCIVSNRGNCALRGLHLIDSSITVLFDLAVVEHKVVRLRRFHIIGWRGDKIAINILSLGH